MDYTISNIYPQQEISKLTFEISRCIKSEPNFHKLSDVRIRELLENNDVILAQLNYNKEVIGFIFRESLNSDYVQLRFWYCKPEYRAQGIGTNIFLMAIRDDKMNYLFSVLNPSIVPFAHKHGFIQIKITELPLSVIYKLMAKKITTLA